MTFVNERLTYKLRTKFFSRKIKKPISNNFSSSIYRSRAVCISLQNPLGDGVIVSHSEGYRCDITSGHANKEI